MDDKKIIEVQITCRIQIMALKESEDQATAGGGGGGHSKEGTQESYLLEYDFGSDSFELVKVRMKGEKETAYDIRQNTHFSFYVYFSHSSLLTIPQINVYFCILKNRMRRFLSVHFSPLR